MDNRANSIENISSLMAENEETHKNNDESLTKLQESLLTPQNTINTLANKSTESVELNVSDKLAITASDNSEDELKTNRTMGKTTKSRKLIDTDDSDGSNSKNSIDKPIMKKLMSSSSDENENESNKKVHTLNRLISNVLSSSDNEESADDTKKSQKKIKKLHKKSSKKKKNAKNSSGSSSSSGGSSSESGEEDEVVNIKQSLQGICDSDSSNDGDYQPNIIDNEKISTNVDKKPIKPIERPPKRMSAKEAEEQMKAIQSESQRLARESNLCVPYHRPKQHSLREFLNRRTINKPIPARDMKKAAAAIKMSKEELIEYAKKLDERAKESQEFFKSESEEEEDEGGNDEEDKKETTKDDNIVNSTEIIQTTTEEIIKETEELKCETLKSTDTNMESFPLFSTEDMLQESEKLCDTKNVSAATSSTATNNDNEPSILPTENDTTPSLSSDTTTITTTTTTTTKTIEIDYNYGDEKLDLISPSAKKFTNLKDSLLARMTTPSVKKSLINGPCRLKGTKNCIIDLDTGKILPSPTVPSGPEELFERFRKHSKKIVNKTTEQNISVISARNGFFEIENIKIKVDEDEPIIQDSKPRSAFFKLKQAFSSKLAAQRKEEILRRKEETEAAKKKAKKLSKEDNEESDDEETDNDEIETENDNNNDGDEDVKEEGKEAAINTEQESNNEEVTLDGKTINDESNINDNNDETNEENMFNSEDEDENKILSDDEESDEENMAQETEIDDEEEENNDDNNKPKSRKRIFLLDDSDNENTENNEEIPKIITNPDELSNDLDDDLLNIGAHKPLGSLILTNNSPKKLFTQSVNECVTESQLYDLCSGNFTTQLPSNNEEMMASQQQLPLPTPTTSTTIEVDQPLRLNLDSSDDENDELHKKTDKNKRKIIKKLSDDEDDDDDDDDGDCGGRMNEKKLIENDSDDEELPPLSLNVIENDSDESDNEEPEEENDKCIEYDSEENEIEVVVTKTERLKKAKAFLENEAELSDSDWGSADEDEKDLDKLEIELGDEEKFDENQLRSELERIHMRRLLDKDAREVKLLKEMLIEDEEDTGLGRERQFKWLNVDNNLDDLTNQKNNEDDSTTGGGGAGDAGSDNENELEWRRMRYERELLLNQSKINDNSGGNGLLQHRVDIEQEMVGQLMGDSPKGGDSAGGGGDTKKNSIVKKKILIIKSSNNTPQLSTNNSHFLIDKEVTKKNTRNSFLGRGEETLARLATLTTKNSAETDGTLPAVAVAAKQRNFVFASITPNTAAEKKNNKRKSNDNKVSSGGGGDCQDTTQIQKKRKTSHENNNNKIKKRLLDILT